MRALAFAILILAGTMARAEPSVEDREKAKALFGSGTSHYNLSEFGDALHDFKEAYRLVNDPALLYNIAQCQRQVGAFDEAARLYRA
jgi:hypothetical protein